MSRLRLVYRSLVALVALVRLHWALKGKGFQHVFPSYVELYRIPKGTGPVAGWQSQGPEWLHAIDIACRLAPWEAQCLHRSFLGFQFLRSRLKLPVDIVIGVRKFPWYAHAWLVLQGRCINEDPNMISDLTVILHSGRKTA